jgi:hypothetical protein
MGADAKTPISVITKNGVFRCAAANMLLFISIPQKENLKNEPLQFPETSRILKRTT